MTVGVTHVFPGFLTPVVTHFFSKPLTTFPTSFSRGEKRKYAGKKVHLNRVSNSQLPGHESDMLTTEPARQRAFFTRTDDSDCDGIHSSLMADHCFKMVMWERSQWLERNVVWRISKRNPRKAWIGAVTPTI